MLTLVVWTFLALVAAAAVLVVAGSAGGRTGSLRGFFRHLVAGLRALRTRRTAPGDDARADAGDDSDEPVETSLDELLAAAEVDDPAYLAVEDLTETLARARERATRGVSALTRR
ncbi:hypothetical protein [Cellulomonas aerilata]|uniref:Uncharacterized protein n=1 Tax=Cellulomonas aerilata TaxID=515326 RepID=A0A512DGP6_9CELL|nr:hypothetical protein [Cellulomonas aerilata]GEO35664.1 hypothetical protein CAE01nite_33890 [Cellulomonas aerilata]